LKDSSCVEDAEEIFESIIPRDAGKYQFKHNNNNKISTSNKQWYILEKQNSKQNIFHKSLND